MGKKIQVKKSKKIFMKKFFYEKIFYFLHHGLLKKFNFS